MNQEQGKIIIEPGAKVLPHELKTAQALASEGMSIHFVCPVNINHVKTADALIDGTRWEFKAPKSANKKAIERNLRRALLQSPCIVFDSRRIKGLPDSSIEAELQACATKRIRALKHLKFVNKRAEVIDIK